MVNRTLEHHLNHLISLMNDSIEGYNKAVELTESRELRTLFAQLSVQRTNFAQELSEMVNVVGGAPVEDGSVKAAIYRAAKELEVSISGNRDLVILKAIRDVLGHTINSYASILADEINITREPVKKIIKKQHKSLIATQTKINDLIAQHESD